MWKLGKTYTSRGGRRLRVLAVDAPVISYPYPIVTMDVANGDLHAHTAEGRLCQDGEESRYDLVKRMRKVEGWTAYVVSPVGSTTCGWFRTGLFPTKEACAAANGAATGVVFGSFEIEEEE